MAADMRGYKDPIFDENNSTTEHTKITIVIITMVLYQ